RRGGGVLPPSATHMDLAQRRRHPRARYALDPPSVAGGLATSGLLLVPALRARPACPPIGAIADRHLGVLWRELVAMVAVGLADVPIRERAVADPIEVVLAGGSPCEVARNVVRPVAVEVAAFHA